MKYIYAITDKDKQNGQTVVTEYVGSSAALTQDEQKILKECLDDSKQNAADNGMTVPTWKLIDEAIDRFQEMTGRTLQYGDDLIQGHFVF